MSTIPPTTRTWRPGAAEIERAAAPLAALATGLALLATLARGIEVAANDDTFVYFTYARNFAEGRPFAYDPRGIPSEGFTSWVHLLLLLPVELAGGNPMAAAVAINLAALGLAALGVARLYARAAGGARGAAGAGLAFLVLAAADWDVRGMASWGLESLLNGCALLWLAGAAAHCARSPDPRAWRRRSLVCFGLGGLAVLVRPENAALLALVAALLLARAPSRRAVLASGLPVAAALGVWLLLKWWLFGDVLPTGYYRKVRLGAPDAWPYVASLVLERPLRAPLALLLGVLPWLRAGASLRPLREPFAWIGALAAATLVLFLNVDPLVGTSHRFLVLPIFAIHAIPALAAARLLERALARRAASRRPASAAPAVEDRPGDLELGLALGCLVAALAWLLVAFASDGGLREHARRAMDEHRYLQIGRALRAALPEPERVVLVFGDAGGIPYELGSIFIDPNGLTEPPIARLSRLRDEGEKRLRFARYVLTQRPDLVVVGYGPPDRRGRVPLAPWRHSPFREPNPHFPNALIEAGFRYGCSVRSFFDLHFALQPGSPGFDAASRALRRVCDEEGYFLEGGLVLLDGETEIRFDPLWRQQPDARTVLNYSASRHARPPPARPARHATRPRVAGDGLPRPSRPLRAAGAGAGSRRPARRRGPAAPERRVPLRGPERRRLLPAE